MRLLVIEDDPVQKVVLERLLVADGHQVDLVSDGIEGRRFALLRVHELIILDLGLPGLEGIEVLRQVRAGGVSCPVLILTAHDGIEERVNGLDLGADDVLIKPYNESELRARIRALARRIPQAVETGVAYGDLVIDQASRSVRRGGRDVPLTPREFTLLHILISNSNKIVDRLELEKSIYQGEPDPISNAIDVLIGRLRRKLEVEGRADPIRTRRSFGYQFVAVAPV